MTWFMNDLRSPWVLSIFLHLGLLSLLALLSWRPNSGKTMPVDFQIYKDPKLAAQVIPITKPIAPAKQARAREVFGVSRRALTRKSERPDNADALIKLGNTVAKAVDREKLKPDDEKSLPIPTAEYLVTKMPVLANEIRIPYPSAAKENGIQGAVVMDLLIDAEGKVREASLVEGPGFGLDEAALAAIQSFLFQPAEIEKKPVAVKIRYIYRFVLER